MPMQKPSRLLPDDSHHLMATDCVLPQVALWGKGMVCALKRTSGLNGWISNQKHISLQSVALREGSCGFEAYYNYTWIWSSLTFGVTVMLGAFAGKIMKEGKADRKRVVQALSVVGVLLIGLAMLWSLQMPVIKRLWTGSMTLLSGGYCFLLMALFYYWIDYKGHSRGLNWLKIYGMNSITAYLLGEVVNFRCIADSVSYGLKQYIGDYYPVWLTFANYLILFFLLRMMYKRGLFLKV